MLVGLCLVIMWGTFFPLISEALTGTEASVGPPWFDRLTTPLALVLVLLTGIGPVLAWRRVTPAAVFRLVRCPARGGAGRAGRAARAHDGGRERALADRCSRFVAFVLSVVGQEFWRGAAARRVMTGESSPRALARLTGRNRRRYGGYLVHAGIAVLFLGVAASSAFLEQRDVRLSPGQTRSKVGGYDVTYLRPTAQLGGDGAGTGAPISLGAVMRVRRGDDSYTDAPGAQLLLDDRPVQGRRSRASSRARPTARSTSAGA